MAFNKKGTSEVVDNAKKKLNAMTKIDTAQNKTVDYGNDSDPLTAATLTAKLQEYDAAMKDYDTAMDTVTEVQNRVNIIEDQLGEYNKRILKSAAGKFKEESDEYEMLGGTRPSERKKPGKKSKTDPPAQ